MASKQNDTKGVDDHVSSVNDYIASVIKNLEKLDKEIREIRLKDTNQQHQNLVNDINPRISS